LEVSECSNEPLAIRNKKCIVRGSLYCKNNNNYHFTVCETGWYDGKASVQKIYIDWCVWMWTQGV